MRRLALALIAAALLAGCSSSAVPRHAAVFSPTERPSPPPRASQAASVAPFDTSGWTALAPDGQGFSVLMPGAAKATTAPISTPAGEATATDWRFEDGDKTFLAERIVTKKGTLSGVTAAKALDEVANGIVGTVKDGQIAEQSDATLNGHSGRALTITNATSVISCRYFVVGDDVYIVLLAHGPGSADDAMLQAYFASFQLTV